MIECFVIMPMRFQETEPIWKNVYCPVIEACGMKPVRIDEEDDGTLLPVQIIQYINNSPLLVADLTLARPNCYFEIGYAMGLNKYNNLILCCRDDHNIHGLKYNKNKELKVHFDLQSYNVLWWDAENLDKFKEELGGSIEKRKAKVTQTISVLNSPASESKAAQLLKLIDEEEKEARKWIKKA